MLVAICALVGFTRSAHAETSAASLGVRSQDGEDELERRLSTALRNAAKSIGDFTVGDRELSLEQMLLAQGCDEPDAKCLQQIAGTLSVERLFYGSVVDRGGAYELTLYMFDGGSKNIETMGAHGIAPELFTAANASDTVEKVLRRLLGKDAPVAPVAASSSTGTLRLEGGVPGTEILIDGQPRGAIDDQGLLVLELPPGNHSVRPAGAEYGQADEQLALVEAGQVDTVRLAVVQVSPSLDDEKPPSLEPVAEPAHSSTRLRRTLGYASIGVGVAMAIATIYSWVRIGNINDDGSYKAYRAAFPRTGSDGGVSNVCVPASRGELASQGSPLAGLERKADKLCSEADRLETLQYVFLGGTVLFGGVGTYLLLTARDRPSQPATTLRVDPRFSAQSAGLAATLSF